jgi:hypothetical protein
MSNGNRRLKGPPLGWSRKAYVPPPPPPPFVLSEKSYRIQLRVLTHLIHGSERPDARYV